MPLAVELRDLTFGYEPRLPVIAGVDLEIPEGQFVAIAGPNGGGKTTLLRLIVGLERPQRGEVLMFGEPVGAAGRQGLVAYLPQRAQLGIEAPATVREVVSAGRVSRRRLLGPLRPHDRDVVDAGDRARRARRSRRTSRSRRSRAASSSAPSSRRRSPRSPGC